jgi:hypothetical protein
MDSEDIPRALKAGKTLTGLLCLNCSTETSISSSLRSGTGGDEESKIPMKMRRAGFFVGRPATFSE